MWREELRAAKRPPFDIGPDTLFVAYSAWAEMTCFLVLDWQFPTHIFDQHTAYLAATTFCCRTTRTKSASASQRACRRRAPPTVIAGWERIDKGTIAKDIGEGRWRDYGQRAGLRIL